MTPTPRYQPGIPNEIVTAVKSVGESLIARELGEDATPTNNWRVLNGNCHENAYYLADALLEQGYEPYLVWGAVTATGSSSLYIDTIDQLERTSRVHFWVEIHPDSIDEADHPLDDITSPVIVELSSETVGHVNCPYVALDRPDRYQRMGVDPSYVRFERSFDPDDLISEESYQRLRARSPELFSTCPWGGGEPTSYSEQHAQTQQPDSSSTQ